MFGFVLDWATRTMVFEEPLTHAPRAGLATIDVGLHDGHAPYIAFSEATIADAAPRGASALLGWSPTSKRPDRAACARISLEPSGLATIAMIEAAAASLRARLAEISLWIPFADAPAYGLLRAALDAFAAEAGAGGARGSRARRNELQDRRALQRATVLAARARRAHRRDARGMGRERPSNVRFRRRLRSRLTATSKATR